MLLASTAIGMVGRKKTAVPSCNGNSAVSERYLRRTLLKRFQPSAVLIEECLPSGCSTSIDQGRLSERFGWVRICSACSIGIAATLAPIALAGARTRQKLSAFEWTTG